MAIRAPSRNSVLSWLRRRLTPGEYFGLELTLGAALFVAAAWIFGELAEDVSRGEPITQVDARIAQWFHVHATGGVTRAMSGLSWFHTWPIGVIAIGFLLYLLARREWLWAIFGLCAVLGGIGLNTLLKLVFHRARPTLSGLSYALQTYSFPSGHTLAATVLYGVFAAYAIRSFASHRAKIGVALGAAAIVALVAFSRLYLGVHYLTDVLAAFVEGIAWLALCYTAAHTFAARRARRA